MQKKKITVKRYARSLAKGTSSEPFNIRVFEISRPHRLAKWRDAEGDLFDGPGYPTRDGQHTHEGQDIVAVYTVESV